MHFNTLKNLSFNDLFHLQNQYYKDPNVLSDDLRVFDADDYFNDLANYLSGKSKIDLIDELIDYMRGLNRPIYDMSDYIFNDKSIGEDEARRQILANGDFINWCKNIPDYDDDPTDIE